MEYTTSQDNISSEVKLPCHLLPAAHYAAPPKPPLISGKGKVTQLTKTMEKLPLAEKGKGEKGEPVE